MPEVFRFSPITPTPTGLTVVPCTPKAAPDGLVATPRTPTPVELLLLPAVPTPDPVVATFTPTTPVPAGLEVDPVTPKPFPLVAVTSPEIAEPEEPVCVTSTMEMELFPFTSSGVTGLEVPIPIS